MTNAEHSLEQCSVGVITDTAYLTGRCHIYTQYGVSILQTVKAELRSLDTYIVEVEQVFLGFSTGRPSITLVVRSMRFSLSTLLTNGKLRDARRLHSITRMSFSRAIYWMLNGPLMCRLWQSGVRYA